MVLLLTKIHGSPLTIACDTTRPAAETFPEILVSKLHIRLRSSSNSVHCFDFLHSLGSPNVVMMYTQEEH